MPHLDLPGTVLHYETAGPVSSPALLLIHADIASLRMWDGIVDDLATDHFVVRYDLRGFGGTVSEDVEFSDRRDALDLLDHLGVERATVVGASRGGMVGLDLALESPERLTGIVTVGSAPSGHPPVDADEGEIRAETAMEELEEQGAWARLSDLEVRVWAIGLTRDESEVDAEFVQLAKALNRANVARVGEEPVAVPLNPPAFGRVGDIRMPALVAIGEDDLSFQQTSHDYLLENLPGASAARFARSAHLPSVEHPAEFLRVLREWLDRHGL
jgi:3-oxoadipate enol-lactonase